MSGQPCFDVRYEGAVFRFPEVSEPDYVHDQIRRRAGFYEEGMLQYLAGLELASGLIIDCGANIGNHSLFFAGVMQRNVIAVEPVARNIAILESVVAVNGLADRVRIVPLALDEVEREVTMTLDSPENSGMYHVGEGSGEVVKATTLDKICDGLGEPVSLIKIDVEGFQDQVLRGAQETLARFKPFVAAELSSEAEFSTFAALLAPHGYHAMEVFNATPTVVFSADPAVKGRPGRVRRRLQNYDRKVAMAEAAS